MTLDRLLWASTPLAAAAVLVAAAFQALTGFGFALLSTAALILLFEPKQAVAVLVAPSLTTACLAFFATRHDFEWARVREYLAFTVLGLAIGVWISERIPGSVLRAVMAVLLLQTLLGARALAVLRPLQGTSVSGIVGGLVAGSLGTPGPAVVSWVHARGWSFAAKRAATLGIFALVELVRLPVYLGRGLLQGREQLVLTAILSLAAAAGALAGGMLSKQLREDTVRGVMKAALAGLFLVTLRAAIVAEH